MSDQNRFFNESLSGVLASLSEGTSQVENKKASVEKRSKAKELMLGGGANGNRMLATGIENQNDMAQGPVAQDLANLNHGQIVSRYGMDIADGAADLGRERRHIREDQRAVRTGEQTRSDALKGFAAGSITGIGGFGAAALGAIPGPAGDLAGGLAAQGVNQAADFFREGQSQRLQTSRDRGQERAALDSQDIQNQYEEDLRHGQVFPSLRRGLSEAGRAVGDLVDNPELAGDLVSEGVGSLISSAGVNALVVRGATKLALRQRGITGDRANEFLRSPQGQALMRERAVKTMPVTIGAMEGGGAYAQIQGEIQKMSEEELMESSEDYRALREDGIDHETARRELANSAALQGGVRQGVTGTATGHVSARFAADPLNLRRGAAPGSFRGALQNTGENVIREGVEETIQAGTAAYHSGEAIRRYADATRDPLEGLGRESVQGAVAGVGMAGVSGAPGLAATGTVAAAETAASNISDELHTMGRGIGSVIDGRVERTEDRIDQSAPSGTTATRQAAQEGQEGLTELRTVLSEPQVVQSNPELYQKSTTQAPSFQQRVEHAVAMPAEEVAATSEAVRQMLPENMDVAEGGQVPRLTAITAVSENIQSQQHSQQVQDDAALWLFEQSQIIQSIRGEDVSSLGEGAVNAVQVTEQAIDTVMENPTIASMVERARQLTHEDFGPSPEISETNIQSPEVQEAFQRSKAMSQSNPAGVDPRFVRSLLDQRSDERVNIEDALVRRLEAAATAAEIGKTAAQQKQQIEAEAQEAVQQQTDGGQKARIRKTTDMVREDILSRGRDNEKGQWGLTRHLSEIVTALSQGRTEEAQSFLDNLRNFGEHMQNKVDAYKRSAELNRNKDNKVSFRAWTGSTFLPEGHSGVKPVWIAPNSQNSLVMGREAVVDAQSVADLYNRVLSIYGDQLSGDALSSIEVPALLRGGTGERTVITGQTEQTSPSDPQTQVQTEASEAVPAQQAEATQAEEGTTTDQPTEQSSETISETDVESTDQTTQERQVQTDEDSGTEAQEADGTQRKGEGTREDSTETADPQERTDQTEATASEGDEAGTGSPVSDADGGETGAITPSFDNLARNKEGQNRFTNAYRINPEKSDLLTRENPARDVISFLGSIQQHEADLGLPYKVDQEKAQTLAHLIEGQVRGLVNRLNKRLQEKRKGLVEGTKSKGNRRFLTPLEAVSERATKDYMSFPEGKVLNLVDPEAGQYDPRIVQSASMAAVHWVMNTTRNENLDYEDISKFFGVPEAELTTEHVRFARLGLRGENAAESLARTIKDFWGAEDVHNAPWSDVDGISQAMAGELLEVMDGHLTTTHSWTPDGSQKRFVTVEVGHQNIEQQVRDIGGLKRFMGDAFAKGETRTYHFEAPKSVAKHQKRNRMAKLGEKIRRAVRRHQEVRFYRTEFAALMSGLGRETYLALMGYQEFDAEKTNTNHANSLRGKNRSLERSWDETIAHDEVVKGVAEQRGITPEEVATHFVWNVGSNNRFMPEGFNPQADKTMRAAFASTIAQLDLNQEENRDAFWATIGQMSDVAKTEYTTRKEVAQQTETSIGETYPRSIEALRSWIRDGVMMEDQKTALREEITAGDNAQLMASLLAVARFREAEAAGGDAWSNFRHSVPMEADGKTDGPIHAMMHFIRDVFTGNQVADLARGGVFISSGRRTLNDHHGEAEANGGKFKDLYGRAADLTSKYFLERARKLNNTPAASPRDAFVRLMDRYSEDFQFNRETGELTIDRGELKNPLTITVYGSGQNGIAGKIANAILDKVYVELTNEASGTKIKNQAQLMKDLQTLMGERVVFDKRQGWGTRDTIEVAGRDVRVKPRVVSDPVKHSFNQLERKMLVENIRLLYVQPMDKAIKEIMGATEPVMRDVMVASQVQAEALIDRFRKTVGERLKEKRASGELGSNEFMSKQDYDAIFEELSRYGVVVSEVGTDGHYLDLAAPERAETSRNFSGSLDGNFRGQSSPKEPGRPGVRAAPMMTISRGDATMMANFFASEDISDSDAWRTLDVFDGLEMPADGIDTISEKINQAVTETWMENPIQDFADSFTDWMRQGQQGPLDGVSQGVRTEISGLLSKEGLGNLTELRDRLQGHARSVQARKNTIKRVGMSNDHMASGESPHVLEGSETVETVSDLNRIYDEELGKLEKASKVSPNRPTVEKPKKRVMSQVRRVGTKMDGREVYAVDSSNITEVFNTASVSPDNKRMAQMLAKSLPDFTFFFGSREDLTALRNERSPEHADAGSIQHGQTDLVGGAVYIANTAGETVLHEMLHTATAKKTFEYYGNPDLLTKSERAALENLEQLMVDFADMSFVNEDPATRRAAERLQREIDHHWHSGDEMGRAHALQEFVAWSLSNQHLVSALKKSRVRSPLRAVAQKALEAIKRLFGLGEGQPMDMFSNIAMNVHEVLTENNLSHLGKMAGSTSALLNQVDGRLSNPRLARLMDQFDRKIAAHLKSRGVVQNTKDEMNINLIADEAVNLITAGGFQMDPQQKSAFRSIQAALASDMELDSGAMMRAHKLFTHVMGRVSNDGFNRLMDHYGSLNDAQGRSTLVASFLALAQVDPQFREALQEIKLPDNREFDGSTADKALETMADGMVNDLATRISGEDRNSRNVLQSLDGLTEVLSKIETDDRNFIEKQANNLLGRGDVLGRNFLSSVGEGLVTMGDQAAQRLRESDRERNADMLAKGARILAGLVDKSRGKAVGSALISSGNTSQNITRPIIELMNEIIGITDENRGVVELVNKVKYAISGVRQDHREVLPRLLKEQFSRELSRDEWSGLTQGVARSDLASLRERMGGDQIRQMLSDDAARSQEINSLQEELSSLAPEVARDYLRKSNELAEYMINGNIDPNNHNLLTNANAIAHLLNEGNRKKAVATPETIRVIDELTTLYALNKLDDGTKRIMKDLSETEADGMDFVSLYLVDLRRREQEKKTNSDLSVFNGYKGYIPMEARPGSDLKVVSDHDHNQMVTLGYTRLGAYEGSGAENGKRSYYYSTVAGSSTYQQGVMQTVSSSSFGVDPRTGFSLTGDVAGRIPKELVGVTRQRLEAQAKRKTKRKTGEALRPVFNGEGNLIGYERHISSEMMKARGQNKHLGEMIGAWAGRQVEEELSQGYNQLLIDRTFEAWEDGRQDGRADEFVDLSDPDLEDVVYREAWKLVPPSTREYISEKFGEDGFMVRKDMINNAVGYRAPSVADAWTGNSRLNPETRKAFRDVATAVFGQNAFPWLVQAEKAWQSGVSAAKSTIVVRSVVVPVANLLSSLGQLKTMGVSNRDIVKGFKTKLVEIEQHLKNKEREVEIKALMARHRDDEQRLKRLEAELKLLDDANRRMTIWPVLEAGEFASISEGVTEADAALTQGRWADWMRSHIEKVPSKLGTVGRYAAVTRDTAMFKGMARATIYGDFLSKSVMYDHMTKREKVPQKEALAKVSEEFVNYNLLPGRTRSYAESMGMTWFWAFKIRSIKIAHRHMRDNPFRALVMTSMIENIPFGRGISAGSPILDNMATVIGDGRFGYSVGPGMITSGVSLNPWVNMAN